MKHHEISAALTAGPATHSWDAVCAMNAERTSRILLQQYLNEGPTHPTMPLRTILRSSTDHSFLLLDLTLGPPDISFADLECSVSMILVKGWVIQFDYRSQKVLSAIQIQPNESELTGDVDLAKVEGEVSQLGKVVVDLATNAYAPKIAGIDGASVLATDIGTAIQTYFAHLSAEYVLGTIGLADIDASLKPTRFELATQQKDTNDKSQGGCVLLLIQTNGPGGSVGTMDTYPIPDGKTAALMVSNQVLFNQLIPPWLTTQFSAIGTTFSGTQDNDGVYSAKGSGGTLDLGKLESADNLIFSSDSSGWPAGVELSAGGFSATASDSNLSVAWSKSFSQWWTRSNIQDGTNTTEEADMTGSYTAAFSAAVDPVTDVITFSGTGSSTFQATKSYKWWQKLFGDFDAPAAAEDQMESTMDATFKNLSLPSVDTFALANLLFPSLHALSLTDASVPCDLLATGDVVPQMQVQPSTAQIDPGAEQQFSVVDAQGNPYTDILWELQGKSHGSIDDKGLYSAPAHAPHPEVVVVTAVDKKKAENVAHAMVIVHESAACTGLLIKPSKLTLTAGQSFDFQVTDTDGNPVDADCSKYPDQDSGTLDEGFDTGEWTYTAPDTVDSIGGVLITATLSADASKTARMQVQLLPTVTVTMSAGSITLTEDEEGLMSLTLTPGQQVTLTASVDGVTDPQLGWATYQQDAKEAWGTLTLVDDSGADTTKATYKAPQTLKADTTVMVAAYLIGQQAGIGEVRVNLKT